jgi:hypothetical protein
MIYRGGLKLEWVPVRTAPNGSCGVVRNLAKGSSGSDGDHGLEPDEMKIADGGSGVKQQEREVGLVQKEVSLEFNMQNSGDKVPLALSSTSQKTESAHMQTDSAMRSISSEFSMRLLPMGSKSSTSTFTCWDSRNGDRQRITTNNVPDQ